MPEETDDRIDVIAAACGYSGEEQLRATFVRPLQIPLLDYRKRLATSERAARLESLSGPEQSAEGSHAAPCPHGRGCSLSSRQIVDRVPCWSDRLPAADRPQVEKLPPFIEGVVIIPWCHRDNLKIPRTRG